MTGLPGNDELSGGDGDDVIFDEAGDDTLDGGEGADQLSGGDDADLIIGGNAGDVADGGAGGTDDDTLDLSGSGPLRVLTQTADADGNSTSSTIGFLDGDGNITGTMEFSEIETLILPENTGLTALEDMAAMEEDDTATIDVLANDSDPEGDPLTVVSATSPDGSVSINADGSLEFAPNPNFNGDAVISYSIADPDGLTSSASVIVDVAEDRHPPDGIVDGTDGADLIDVTYTGDPDGDRVDAGDALLQGEFGDDDIIRAGDGDDTVLA